MKGSEPSVSSAQIGSQCVQAFVAISGDGVGQRKVNNVAPESPSGSELMRLNQALSPAIPIDHKRPASTSNPKAAGSNPARPTSHDETAISLVRLGDEADDVRADGAVRDGCGRADAAKTVRDGVQRVVAGWDDQPVPVVRARGGGVRDEAAGAIGCRHLKNACQAMTGNVADANLTRDACA